MLPEWTLLTYVILQLEEQLHQLSSNKQHPNRIGMNNFSCKFQFIKLISLLPRPSFQRGLHVP